MALRLFAKPSIIFVACIMSVSVIGSGCMAPRDDGEEGLTFANHPMLGEILTDAGGRTLYVFTNDDPGKSNCYDQCAVNWPPYVLESLPEAPEAMADEMSLVERTDGTSQAAYRERPLYYYVGDTQDGDAKGDGLNGVWFVVRRPPTNSQMLNGEGSNEVDAQMVSYSGTVNGYFARPNGQNASLGVVMIHEWWGLNQNIKDMADLLASHGYAVLAVDLFNGSVATTSQQAQQQVGALNQAHANQNMRDAAAYLRGQGAQDIAGLGWCFGGGQSLQLALSGEILVGTAIYYGFLVTDESRLDNISWPVLGIFGEADQAIPVSSVRAFERALGNVSVESDIYIYPDVGHAFANPSGDAWAPDETKDAWIRTLDFLEQVAS